MYWEWPRYDWSRQEYAERMQAIRIGDMKLLRHREGDPWELYNIATDPGETADLAASYLGLVERMSRRIPGLRESRRMIPEPEKPEGRRYR